MAEAIPSELATLPNSGDFASACSSVALRLGLRDPRADFVIRSRDPRQDMQYGESLILAEDAAPYRRASRILARARRLWPQCPGAWLAAGATETILARFRAALPFLSRASRLAPDSEWVAAWRGVAFALDARRRRDARLGVALTELNKVVTPGTAVEFAAPWRAELLHDLDRHDLALEDLARITPASASWLWSRVERGEILCESGRADEALREFDRLVAEYPKASWAWALRGRTLATTGHAARGLRDLNRAVVLSPKSAAARAWRSEALRRVGSYRAALNDLNRATRLDPHFTLAWIWRGRLQLALRRPERALYDLDRAVRLDRRYRLGLLWRGEALFKLGRTREAARDFRFAAPMDPKRAWTFPVHEGVAPDSAGRETAFWADMQKRVKKSPHDAWARRILREALRREYSSRNPS